MEKSVDLFFTHHFWWHDAAKWQKSVQAWMHLVGNCESNWTCFWGRGRFSCWTNCISRSFHRGAVTDRQMVVPSRVQEDAYFSQLEEGWRPYTMSSHIARTFNLLFAPFTQVINTYAIGWRRFADSPTDSLVMKSDFCVLAYHWSFPNDLLTIHPTSLPRCITFRPWKLMFCLCTCDCVRMWTESLTLTLFAG